MFVAVKIAGALGMGLTFLAALLLSIFTVFEHLTLAGNRLYLSSLAQLRGAELVAWEPFDILDSMILEYGGNSEEIFLDALRIADDTFFVNGNDCACKLLILDYPTGLYVLRHFGDTTVRLIFKFEKAGPSLIDATITFRTL
jgi:hypothetical protein